MARSLEPRGWLSTYMMALQSVGKIHSATESLTLPSVTLVCPGGQTSILRASISPVLHHHTLVESIM
jgi:hypothetical protein